MTRERLHRLGILRTLLTAFCLLLVFTSSAHAFKIEGHVWLADQIAKEIAESGGSLEILGESYQVDPAIVTALDKDPGAFLMGVMGADVYPDMVAGQMTTHPGLNESIGSAVAWQTDDWLHHVLTEALDSGDDSAIAFACGYLLHAAMDMWAHTYVNLYAGDVFSIMEYPEVAERHVALEAYFVKFHEPLLGADPQPSPGGDAYSTLHVPAEFVRKTLILNDDAALQYDHEPTTFYLSLIHDLWRDLDRKRDGAQSVVDSTSTLLDFINPLLDSLAVAKKEVESKEEVFRGHLERLSEGAQDLLDAAVGVADSTGLLDQLGNAGIDIDLDAPAQAAKSALDTAFKSYEEAVENLGWGADLALDPEGIREHFDAALSAFPVELIDAWQANIEAAMDAYVEAWEETAKELMRPKGTRFTPGSDPTQALTNWALCWGPALGIPSPDLAKLAAVGCEDSAEAYNSVIEGLELLQDELSDYIPLVADLKEAIDAFDASLAELEVQEMKDVSDALGKLGPDSNLDVSGFANWIFTMWDKDMKRKDVDQAYQDSSSPVGFVRGRVTPAVHRELGVCEEIGAPAVTYEDPPIRDFAPFQNAVTMSKLALLNGERLNLLMKRLDGASGVGPGSKGGGTTINAAGIDGTNANLSEASVDDVELLAHPFYDSDLPVGVVFFGALRSIDGDHQWLPIAPPIPREGGEIDDVDGECRHFGYPANHLYGTNCEDDLYDDVAQTLNLRQRSGFLIANGFRLETVFSQLFQPVAPELCSFIGSTSHPGLFCSTGEAFPSYDPAADRPAEMGPPTLQPCPTAEEPGTLRIVGFLVAVVVSIVVSAQVARRRRRRPTT